MKKKISLIMVLVLLVGLVGVTLAWLTDKTDSVVNTFTSGDINIKLEETKDDFKMVPGHTIEKDPVVTVADDSEDAWLFVKIDRSSNFDSFMEIVIADGWTKLTAVTEEVYYREVLATASVKAFGVLKDDEVVVKDVVTKEMLDAIGTTPDGQTDPIPSPSLTFTAYAHQLFTGGDPEKFTANEAWAELMTP